MDSGAGQPVILMHWTPGSGRQYQHVLGELAALGYQAIAPDHMGFGFSDARPRPWGVGDYAKNILDVMTAMGLESAAPLPVCRSIGRRRQERP